MSGDLHYCEVYQPCLLMLSFPNVMSSPPETWKSAVPFVGQDRYPYPLPCPRFLADDTSRSWMGIVDLQYRGILCNITRNDD